MSRALNDLAPDFRRIAVEFLAALLEDGIAVMIVATGNVIRSRHGKTNRQALYEVFQNHRGVRNHSPQSWGSGRLASLVSSLPRRFAKGFSCQEPKPLQCDLGEVGQGQSRETASARHPSKSTHSRPRHSGLRRPLRLLRRDGAGVPDYRSHRSERGCAPSRIEQAQAPAWQLLDHGLLVAAKKQIPRGVSGSLLQLQLRSRTQRRGLSS